MVRSLVLGFGAATLLAAAGSMTPAGQLILGVKGAAAAPGIAAVVRPDKPAAKRVVAAKPSPRARPRSRPAAVARRQAAPAPSGQSVNVAQFLPLLLQPQSFPSLQPQPTSAASPLAGILGGGASPLAGMLGGGSSLTDLLQSATSPAPAAEPASAPQSVQAPAPVAPAQSPLPQGTKPLREE